MHESTLKPAVDEIVSCLDDERLQAWFQRILLTESNLMDCVVVGVLTNYQFMCFMRAVHSEMKEKIIAARQDCCFKYGKDIVAMATIRKAQQILVGEAPKSMAEPESLDIANPRDPEQSASEAECLNTVVVESLPQANPRSFA